MTTLRSRLQVLLGALTGAILLGTVGFAAAEGLSLADAFYFSLVTIATVGYGDIHPTTAAGKALAVIIILGGAGVFISFLGTAAEYFLSSRERQVRREKLHMVMGVFFSEVGTDLLRLLADRDPDVAALRGRLAGLSQWEREDFSRVGEILRGHDCRLELDRADLNAVFELLGANRRMLLRIIENPSLHEHESFTELLRASFHLLEELGLRGDFSRLPESDVEHLEGDVRRVYRQLIPQWAEYLGYLNENYAYLFSLSLRTNPFDPEASAIVS